MRYPDYDPYWPDEYEQQLRKLNAASGKAGTDRDFLALRAAYLAHIAEDHGLLGLMRDRLLDLGVADEVARQVVNELRMSHPANEIPF